MPLENHYPGDAVFAEYSAAFLAEWELFKHQSSLLSEIGGDVELARPIAWHCGENYGEWLRAKIPALEHISPLDCLKTKAGIRRLKSCLLRMP